MRYRFAEPGRWPLDVGASAELESGRAGGEFEPAFTPRLVLSRGLLRAFDTTLDLDFPVELKGESEVSFAWALGLAYPEEGRVRAGIELKQSAAEHTASVFPQVWYCPAKEVILKLGTGLGLNRRTDPVTARFLVEFEI